MDDCPVQSNSEESYTDSDLIGSFGTTEDSQTKKPLKYFPQVVTQTCSEVSTSILGSLESFALPSCLSEMSLFRSSNVSNTTPLSSCWESSTSSGSDSHSSFTKPITGQNSSDSCIPASCIFDEDEKDIKKELPVENDKKVGYLDKGKGYKLLRRASSCDTSKGIDDIEDFEVDDIHDFDLPLEVHDGKFRNL